MYCQLANNLDIKSTKQLRYSRYNKLDAPLKAKCSQVFPSHNFTDEFTVWYQDNSTPILLGYVQLIHCSVQQSKYYSSKVYNSWQLEGAEPYEMANQQAFQIVNWELDAVLKNKDYLINLFMAIEEEVNNINNLVLVWRDGSEDMDCYPIPADYRQNRTYAFGTYFADVFMKL